MGLDHASLTSPAALGVATRRRMFEFIRQERLASLAGIRKAGRRPKVYEPVAEAVAVNIPERRYGMPADVLTEAVLTETEGEPARDAALRVAYARGETLGEAERERVRPANNDG